MKRIVFFDLETGGLNPDCHPIIQIAAIAVDSTTLEEVDSFVRKIHFDEADADAEALRVNHYDPAVWKSEAIREVDARRFFAEFLQAHATVEQISKRTGRPFYVAQLAGHNIATFDMRFLQAWFARSRAFLPASFLPMDTLQRAIWYFHEHPETRPENLKLETLCRFFGVPIVEGRAHDALEDVRGCIRFYAALRGAELGALAGRSAT